MPSPHMPTKYLGPQVFYAPTVTRTRQPLGTDYIQPETGKYYAISTIWQVGKNPTTGVEGEMWILTKIVSNVAYWELFTTAATGTVTALADSNMVEVGPNGDGLINVIGDTNSIITTAVDGILPNTLRVKVKVGEKNASAVAGKAGVLSVNSAQFNIDTLTGWVSLVGGAGPAVNQFTTTTGGPVSASAGNINLTGATTTYTDGSVANTVRTEVMGTNHALFVGRGASSPAAVLSVGTNGQVLIAATGADPAFATLTSSDSSISFTVGPNTLSLQVAGGTSVGKTITGDSGGALSPTAGNWNIVGGTTAAGTSPVVTAGSGSTLTVNVQRAQAISAGDTTKVGLANFDSKYFSVTSGFVSWVLPTSFSAYLDASVANVTGDATPYVIICNSTTLNQGSAYDTGTGNFVAPGTGIYQFNASITINNVGAGHTAARLLLRIQNGSGTDQQLIGIAECSAATCASSSAQMEFSGAATVPMTSGWKANLVVIVSGSTKTVGVGGGAAPNEPKCSFSGFCVALT